MEEIEMQKKEEPVKEAEVKKDEPKGYYLGQVPSSYTNVLLLDGKPVDAQEALVKALNALKNAGLMD